MAALSYEFIDEPKMAGVDSKAIGKSDPTEKLYLSYEVLESAKENAYKVCLKGHLCRLQYVRQIYRY